jgi:hypothetical protein
MKQLTQDRIPLFKDNLVKITNELEIQREELKMIEKEYAIKIKYGSHKIDPEYAYEKTAEWKEYVQEITESSLQRHQKTRSEKITFLENAVKEESARLRLMEDGVPAWDWKTNDPRLGEYYETKMSKSD